MTSVAFAPCLSALRFLPAINVTLILVVNRRRKRAIALTLNQLESDESWCHAFLYGDNYFLMANIASPSSCGGLKITPNTNPTSRARTAESLNADRGNQLRYAEMMSV